MTPAESAARQASAELEQARRIQRQEHAVVVETLAGMFPQLEREVIDDVVRLKEGRYVLFFMSFFFIFSIRTIVFLVPTTSC